jgi:hypothetical protein
MSAKPSASHRSPEHQRWVALLGKQVRVTLDDHDESAVTNGTLLGFSDSGDVEVLEDDGFIHHCWPGLVIEPVAG